MLPRPELRDGQAHGPKEVQGSTGLMREPSLGAVFISVFVSVVLAA